jgi:hypothetical protein
LSLREELQDKAGIATSLANLAQVELALGMEPHLARPLLHSALAMRVELGEQFYVAKSLLSLGELADQMNEPERAVRWMAASVSLRERIQAAPEGAERRQLDAVLSRLRARLGDAAFTAQWTLGSTTPVANLTADDLGEDP